MKKIRVLLLLLFLVGVAYVVAPLFYSDSQFNSVNWGLATTIFAIWIILAIFFEFESKALGSKEIALVAMLGTISAVLRIPFVAIPSVQPCSYLIICSGYVFGPIAGFMVGALTVIVSNFFIGLHLGWLFAE